MSNLIIKTELLESLDEVDSTPDRELVFSSGEENPARAVDATCNTLDLILQGMALDGYVDLDHFSEAGIHRCQGCGQIYWGQQLCESCGHENYSQDDGSEGSGEGYEEPETDHETPELTEIQQIFLQKVNIRDLSILLHEAAVVPCFPDNIPCALALDGRIETSHLAYTSDEELVALLVTLRTPGLPEQVWEIFKGEYGELAHALARQCQPQQAILGFAARALGRVLWDTSESGLGQQDDEDLANLYLKWASPGSEIPQCVQDALIG